MPMIKIVPKINIKEGNGIARAGRPVDVDEDRGKSLIKDGKASEYVEPQKEPEDDDEKGDKPGFVDEDGKFVPLDSLKVPELKELAKDHEIEGYEQMNKGQLIEAIANAGETDEGGEQ